MSPCSQITHIVYYPYHLYYSYSILDFLSPSILELRTEDCGTGTLRNRLEEHGEGEQSGGKHRGLLTDGWWGNTGLFLFLWVFQPSLHPHRSLIPQTESKQSGET